MEQESYWIKARGYSLDYNHKKMKNERPQVQMGKYSDYSAFFQKNKDWCFWSFITQFIFNVNLKKKPSIFYPVTHKINTELKMFSLLHFFQSLHSEKGWR